MTPFFEVFLPAIFGISLGLALWMLLFLLIDDTRKRVK